MDIILASASPRRKEILSSAGYNFKVIPSNYDENICDKIYSKKLVEACAYNKALDINNNKDLIVSADTVVVLNNKILGKPKNKSNAIDTLLLLSNKTHFVATSICLIKEEKILIGTEITYVKFRELSVCDIKKYIETENPLDKAGSYGIQDNTFDFAIRVDGNMDNVIGFPMTLFNDLYSKL